MFSWIQRKIKGTQAITKTSTGSSTSYTRPSTCGEEFSDWPNELLAIGTFGNNTVKELGTLSSLQETSSNLQETSSTLTKEPQNDVVEESGETDMVIYEEFSACMDISKDRSERRNEENCDDSVKMDRRFERNMSIAERRGQSYIHLEKEKYTSIQKQSLSYLFKKVFACSGGFTPKPTVFIDPLFPRDSLFPESKFKTSKLEKILRALLHKKVYPQGSSPRTALKKYLDTEYRNDIVESDDDNSDDDSSDDGGKWVKDDSEYIVLEI